jgi:hypothetical protein
MIGGNITTSTQRPQTHSLMPSGEFQLSYEWNHNAKLASIPISADPDTFRSIFADTTHHHVSSLCFLFVTLE